MDIKRDHVQKILVFTMKTCYRSACDHPFVLGMLLFSFFLYRCVPRLFFFLVSSSPVVICTAVLLGALLSYGNAYIPEIEEEEDEADEKIRKTHHGISSLRSGGVGNELVVEKDESFSVDSYVGKRRDLGVSELMEKKLIFEQEHNHDGDGGDDGDDEEEEGSVSDESDGEVELGKKGHDQKVLIGGVDEGKPLIEDENDVVVQYTGVEGEEPENFGSIQYSAISKGIDGNGESSDYDSESDRAESSSPDASMADIMPMLDELHPLLDSEHFQQAPILAEDDVASIDSDVSSEDSKSSDESEEEEAENEEREHDGEEEEEKQGGRDDGAEAVVTWTKEDEKNLMDLGNSELERNRRLENLIARRRSRKNMRMMMTERNLIDFDVGDHPFQMAPISTARRNPFDFHYDSNEGIDLPPIPGSAPSVLAPRRNPFDIPYDPLEERPNLAGGSFEEEVFTSLEKETHFRRYESFSVGSSSLGESKQQKPRSKFRPYFVPEQLHSEELGHPTFQRQSSELSESKMSSVTEVESVSSGSDQDDHKQMLHDEQESSLPMLHLEREMSQPVPHVLSQPMPSAEHVPDSVHEASSSSSSEVDLVESDREYHRDVTGDEENAHERESVSPETESMLSPVGSDITDVVKEDVVEDKHIELSSSFSSEVNESPLHMNKSEGTENVEPKPEPDNGSINSSAQPTGENSDIRNVVEEGEDSQIKEPVYDWNWSPSEVEKTLSGITIIEEALSYVDKRGVASTSSIASDMPVEDLDASLTPVQVERTISSMDEDLLVNSATIEEATTSSNEELGVMSSHLHAVEENELSSEEVHAIIEHDVVDNGSSGDIHNDHTSQPDMVVEDPKFAHMSYEDSTSPTESAENSTQNISETPPPLSENQITPSAGGDHENSQEPASPASSSVNEVDAIEDSWEVVHEDGAADSSKHSEISEVEPATRELNYEGDLHDEIQSSRYTEDFMNSNVVATAGEVTDEEFNVAGEISEIDEELLTELDAVGDFSIREEELTNLSVNELHGNLMRPQAQDHTRGAEGSVEAVRDTEVIESRSIGEVQSTVNEMECQPITSGSVEGSHDVPLQSLESSVEEKLDFQEVMSESVDENSSKDEETLEPSSSRNTQENVKPDAVTDITLEAHEMSTNQSEHLSVVDEQGNLAGLRVHEDNSSKEVRENSNKTQDLMGAPTNVRDFELTSTEEEFFTPKIRANEVESEGVPGFFSTGVSGSTLNVKSDSEEFLAGEAITSVKQMDSGDKETTVLSMSRTDADGVEDMKTNKSENDVIQVLEDNSANDVEKDSHEIHNSPDALDDLPKPETRSDREVHVTPKLVLDTMDEELKPSESLEESEENEADYHKSEDSVEVLVHLQDVEPRTEEMHAAAKQPSVDATEEELKPSESVDNSADIEANDSLKPEHSSEVQGHEPRTEGDVHASAKQLSVDAKELKPSETLDELDEIEAQDSLKSEDSAEVHLQGLEPRTEEVHVAAKELSVDAMEDEQTTTDFVES